MKRQFVLSFVHPARVCNTEKGGTRAHVPPLFFHALSRQLCPLPPRAKDPSFRTPPPSEHNDADAGDDVANVFFVVVVIDNNDGGDDVGNGADAGPPPGKRRRRR